MTDSDEYWDEDEFEKELYDPDDPSDAYIKYHRGSNVFVVIEGSFDDPNSVVVKGDVIKDMDKNVEVYLRGNYNKVMKVEQRFVFDNEDNAEDYAEERDMEGYDRPKPKKPKPPPKPQKIKTNPKTRRVRQEGDTKLIYQEQEDGSVSEIRFVWKDGDWQLMRPKTPKKGVAGTGLTNAEIRAKIKARKEAVKAVAKTPKPMTKAEILKKNMDEFEAFLDEDTPTQATILPPLSDSTKKKAMPTFTPEQLMARERRRKFSLPSI
tara:strand:+ start:2070 stop:2861 length:792 start_codon:yes stop_codon:yes gene_type:complete